MAGDPKGWTKLRIRQRTRDLIEAERVWRQSAYETGRSRRPLPNGVQVTLDDIVFEAVSFVRSERRRKNRPYHG